MALEYFFHYGLQIGQRYINKNKISQHRGKHEANCILFTFEKIETIEMEPMLRTNTYQFFQNASKMQICFMFPPVLWCFIFVNVTTIYENITHLGHHSLS